MLDIQYKLLPKIIRQGFPTTHKLYPEAHSEALEAEKKAFPQGYSVLKKLEKSFPMDELMGTNDKKGNIYVSSKVPQQYREEVAFHEQVESLAFKRLAKEKGIKL